MLTALVETPVVSARYVRGSRANWVAASRSFVQPRLQGPRITHVALYTRHENIGVR
jgi:hypothetical protein